MTQNLLVFVLGVIALALWIRGIVKGTMLRFMSGAGLFVDRTAKPFRFWFATGIYGLIILPLLVIPVLFWQGWHF
jgi:hypothetical protein